GLRRRRLSVRAAVDDRERRQESALGHTHEARLGTSSLETRRRRLAARPAAKRPARTPDRLNPQWHVISSSVYALLPARIERGFFLGFTAAHSIDCPSFLTRAAPTFTTA
ncbi:hypothetical protein, partial [Paraburkholderia caledonica]|uniref:hypothetical protein n=1 Tax=Paraburkholderia caledonica TaxID=134536 RepID=UPI003CB35B98